MANGNGTYPSSSDQDPAWLDGAANTVSLAFIDPSELDDAGRLGEAGGGGLPLAFEQHVAALTEKGLRVFFSIGGASFADRWTFLRSEARARRAAVVCAGWARRYGVGIEIDYEGPDAQSAGWTVSSPAGASRISTTFAHLGAFIEEYRAHVPFGSKNFGWLTMDLYASQGGAPCLSYFANRYLPGMPKGNPPWIKSGDAVGHKLDGLDWINIMVAGSDAFASSRAFLDGYVGAAAHVANQYNPVGIVAALPAARATISLIASNHCKRYDADLSQMVEYVRGEGVAGIMFWAVAPFGCVSASNPLRVADWSCECNSKAPGLVAGKTALLK